MDAEAKAAMKKQFEDVMGDEQQMKEIVESTFDSFDADGNKFIDAKELTTFLNQTHADLHLEKPSAEHINQAMKETDTNHDMKLSKEEMMNLCKLILKLTYDTLCA